MRHSHRKAALVLTTLLLLLTACRNDELSLPVTHAAGSERPSQPALVQTGRTTRARFQLAPGASCYAFMLFRPRGQRATAVQARLAQADRMAAALDPEMVTVDVIGDHANILSLQAPVRWPPPPAYTKRLSAVIEEYFASPDIEDYMCNSGFAQVRFSALDLNENRVHPLWTARVTSEGLLKVKADGEQVAGADLLPLPSEASARMEPVWEPEPVAPGEEAHRRVEPGTR